MNHTFLEDVIEGLSGNPKSLPSRYFYDKRGDELFVRIMGLQEYYLTRAELDIFTQQTQELTSALGFTKNNPFLLTELGAGDGKKTKHLLRYLVSEGYSFTYSPVDISQNALDGLSASLSTEIPDLKISPLQGEYFEVLQTLREYVMPMTVLFLGSNIGNMLDNRANRFLKELGNCLYSGDRFLLGVDLIKDASIVIPAYNDNQGITKEFNMNLLHRINRELDGNFETEQFEHVVTYKKEEGIVRSFLKSSVDQVINIKAANKQFTFKAGESIQTEISRKYSDALIREILRDTPFEFYQKLTDSNGYFADYVLGKP